MKIQAMVTREPNTFHLETVELDEPKGSEVRVKLVACGVCHTDAAAAAQIIPVPFPAVMGHEGVGIVEAVGPNATELKVGDHVIMSFPSCGCCDPCKRNRPYACKVSYPLFFGGKYMDGTMRMHKDGEGIATFFGQSGFATHSIVDERNAIKVDPSIDLAPLCSLGCGIQTGAGSVLNKLKPEPGSSLVVIGCGAVGMAAIMAAKIAGCSIIIGVDVVPERLALAKELGATHVVNGREVNTVEEVRKITDGGANYSVECSGVPALGLQAIDCLGLEGQAVFVSVTGDKTITITPEAQIMTPCRTISGLVEGGSNPKTFIPKLVQFYAEGKLPVDKLTKYYKFTEIEQAFADSHSGEVIKPVLIFD